MRYRIEVRCRRGEHRYTYVEHDRVKPGKAQRVLDETAVGIAEHEGRAGLARPSFDYHIECACGDDIRPVTVAFPVFDIEFHVSAVPLQRGE